MESDTVNRLLRNELSSVETYRQILDKFRQDFGHVAAFQDLDAVYRDHEDTVRILETQVEQLGETPVRDSGAWGSWAKIVLGSAQLLGDKAALKALQEGEKSDARDYRRASQEEADMSLEVKRLIQNNLLPRAQAHIQVLDSLMQGL